MAIQFNKFSTYISFIIIFLGSTFQGFGMDTNVRILHYVKVFSENSEEGNLAGVVCGADDLDPSVMQAIAKEVGASETAFISSSAKADLKLRWFTPNTEVGLCIHATIAALVTLTKLNLLERDSVDIETKNAILRARRMEGNWFIYVDNYTVSQKDVDTQILQDYLGIEKNDILKTPRIVQVFDDDELIVLVKSLDILKRLTPDLFLYANLCKKLKVTGISIVTPQTFDNRRHYHTREFAPLYGYLEDPLCGMAAGAIVTYLGISENHIEIEQGDFLNSPGIIKVIPNQNGVWIGGSGVVYQNTVINF